MARRSNDTDMTAGPIGRHIVRFALPLMLGLLFQQLYNTVDTVVVGQFVGKEALAAVGSTSSIINMLVGLCAGLSAGASVVISQSYGAHDAKKLSLAVHTTVTVTFLLALVATFAGMLIVRPMLRLMDTPQDVLPVAATYLTIYFAGIGGLLVYNMGSAILRAVGDSRRPLYFLCVSATLNIVFDLLFVVAFGWGVEGVAFATVVAQALSAALVLWVLSRDRAAYGLRWRKLGLDRPALHRIFALGLPASVQQGLTSFSNVFVQSYINFFGSACMAGWSSYNKLDSLILVPIQAIGLASTTFVGQNYGARQLPRARRGVRRAIALSASVALGLTAVVMILARPLVSLFSNEEEVIAFGVYFVRLVSPFYAAMCFNQIFAGALRGIGKAKVPMVVMLFSFVAFRQGYLFAVRQLGNSLTMVAMAYPFGWILCSVLLYVCFRRSLLCHAPAQPLRDTAADS